MSPMITRGLLLVFVFSLGSCWVAWIELELRYLLPISPQSWGRRQCHHAQLRPHLLGHLCIPELAQCPIHNTHKLSDWWADG